MRGNGVITFNTKFVSMSKSRVMGDGYLSRSFPVRQASTPEFHGCSQWPSEEGMHEVIAWVWGSVTSSQYSGTVHLGSQRSHVRTLLSEGMAYGRAKVEASCLLLHVVVACTLVELHQAFPSPQASEVGTPCCQGTQCGVVSSHP